MAESGVSPSDFVNELIKSQDFKTFFKDLINEAVADKLSQLNNEVVDLRKEITDLKEDVEKLKGENLGQQSTLNKLTKASNKNEMLRNDVSNRLNARSVDLEELQQYTRRNCVLINGVPEHKGENTNDVVVNIAQEKMGIELEPEDLDRSHRIGKFKAPGKHRPLIVKFARYNVRQNFMKNRKQLKGTSIGVSDLLTKFSQHLLHRANELVDQSRHVKAAWSWDGKVHVLIQHDGQPSRKLTINNQKNLQDDFGESPQRPVEDTSGTSASGNDDA